MQHHPRIIRRTPCNLALPPRRTLAHLVTAIIALPLLSGPQDTAAHDSGKTYVLDARALPLGDGRISQQAQRGHVWACRAPVGGGGAHVVGPWISGSTWDSTSKAFVAGDITWPQAWLQLEIQERTRSIRTVGVPQGHGTGSFPIHYSDPAYQWDRNPNNIQAKERRYAIPAMPSLAPTSRCLPMGAVGVMLDGVVIFNALDGEGRDAVAHEVQDRCNGHPERSGQYHYHGPSPCVPGATENQRLLGYALDGFGIYSMFDENGRELTNADLDECHGRTSKIVWDGMEVTMYHYVLTREYPYTVGCYRGTPASAGLGMDSQRPVIPPPGMGPRRAPW